MRELPNQSSARLKIALSSYRSKSKSHVGYSMFTALMKIAPDVKAQQYMLHAFDDAWRSGGDYEQLRLVSKWYYEAMWQDVWPWDGAL